jgi:hypothetical protein
VHTVLSNHTRMYPRVAGALPAVTRSRLEGPRTDLAPWRRPPIASVFTAIRTDLRLEQVFAREVRILGRPSGVAANPPQPQHDPRPRSGVRIGHHCSAARWQQGRASPRAPVRPSILNMIAARELPCSYWMRRGFGHARGLRRLRPFANIWFPRLMEGVFGVITICS